MSTAIKFTLDSGDVDFLDDEMCSIVEAPEQNIIQHIAQQKASTVKVYDTQYKSWKLTIQDVHYGTLSRILEVINEESEMVFYPHYQYDSGTSYNVVLVPNEVSKNYAFGERAALLMVTFNLLESSK